MSLTVVLHPHQWLVGGGGEEEREKRKEAKPSQHAADLEHVRLHVFDTFKNESRSHCFIVDAHMLTVGSPLSQPARKREQQHPPQLSCRAENGPSCMSLSNKPLPR